MLSEIRGVAHCDAEKSGTIPVVLGTDWDCPIRSNFSGLICANPSSFQTVWLRPFPLSKAFAALNPKACDINDDDSAEKRYRILPFGSDVPCLLGAANRSDPAAIPSDDSMADISNSGWSIRADIAREIGMRDGSVDAFAVDLISTG